MKRGARRAELAAQAVALFDEITTSDTPWSEPRAIDQLIRDVVLHPLGLADRHRARQVLLIALEGAAENDLADAVASLRTDRDAMLDSVAQDYERELIRWRASQPRPPLPIAPVVPRRPRPRAR